MAFLILIALAVIAYFMYSIAEALMDISDELRAANRNRETAMQLDIESKAELSEPKADAKASHVVVAPNIDAQTVS